MIGGEVLVVFFFKQKTAYDMRISDWSSDVCSSDLVAQASKAIVAEAFEVRELLEGLCARRAARHVRDGGSNDALRIAASEERRRSLDEEPLALMQANERLHQLIVSVGSSATAERMLESSEERRVRKERGRTCKTW